MICNMTKGGNAYGLMKYLLGEKGQNGHVRQYARVIGGTIDGDTVEELTKNFMFVRALRPSLGIYMVNAPLRLADGETLQPRQWAELGSAWAEMMGFDTYSIVQHSDQEIHVAAIRIRAQDGTTVSDSHDWQRSESIVRNLEKQFGLRKTESSHLLKRAGTKTHGRGKTKARCEELWVPAFVRDKIEQVIRGGNGSISATDFINALDMFNIRVFANVASTGKMSGFSYYCGDEKIKSEDMGNIYKWSTFQERVIYNQELDFERCRETRVAHFNANANVSESDKSDLDDTSQGCALSAL